MKRRRADVACGDGLRPLFAATLALASCRAPEPEPATPAPANVEQAAEVDVRCEVDRTAPASLEVPEASAAAIVPGASGAELVVLADSDRKGAALVVPLDAAEDARAIRLPLDAAASDDVEGAAFAGGLLYTLTSSGWGRAYRRDATGDFELALPAWPLAEPPLACRDPRITNCASNFEGLCLRETPAGAVVGFAAAKETSTLYPVVRDGDGRLRLDPATRPLALSLARRTVSDCAFGPDGRLLVATNLLGLDRVYEVDLSTGATAPLAVAGLLNDEALAVDPRGRLWLLQDDGKSPSALRRFDCVWPRPRR